MHTTLPSPIPYTKSGFYPGWSWVLPCSGPRALMGVMWMWEVSRSNAKYPFWSVFWEWLIGCPSLQSTCPILRLWTQRSRKEVCALPSAHDVWWRNISLIFLLWEDRIHDQLIPLKTILADAMNRAYRPFAKFFHKHCQMSCYLIESLQSFLRKLTVSPSSRWRSSDLERSKGLVGVMESLVSKSRTHLPSPSPASFHISQVGERKTGSFSLLLSVASFVKWANANKLSGFDSC